MEGLNNYNAAYLFLNNDTGEFFEDFLTNSKKEDLLARTLTTYENCIRNHFYGRLHIGKTDDTWKEVLSKVGEHTRIYGHPRYGRKI